MAFKANLFSSLETRPSEPFFVKLRGDGPHEVYCIILPIFIVILFHYFIIFKNAETNVKVPLMTTTNTFPMVQDRHDGTWLLIV